LKERAATHGITAPADDQGEKATWIAAIQQRKETVLGGSQMFARARSLSHPRHNLTGLMCLAFIKSFPAQTKQSETNRPLNLEF
jgi:hypothetical protein